MKGLPPLAALLLWPLAGWAQGGVNLIPNGGMERFTTVDDRWDGVDADGHLAGFVWMSDILSESGQIAATAMPVTPTVIDINNDGLLDLVVGEAGGYVRVYLNSGTKTAPKFTHSELASIFLGRVDLNFGGPGRAGVKINAADWDRNGTADLIGGNYLGEVLYVPNSGSPTVPDWRQPPNAEALVIKTMKSGQLWGNLLAPASADWNRDGRMDLLVGEGSYSANAIHLFVNQSSSSRPAFDENHRSYVAYGDGREQLTPAVVDYNFDGSPDLIVGDRHGQIGVYLSVRSAAPGTELKFRKLIEGVDDPNGGMVAPATGDLNGDGKWDLVVGRSNGRIGIAYNQGTLTEPKFTAPVDLEGTDVYGRNVNVPEGWDLDFGLARGNFNGVVSVVSAADDPEAQPPEGTHALKVSYDRSLNRLLKIAAINPPSDPKFDYFFDHFNGAASMIPTADGNSRAPVNTFRMRAPLTAPLKVGATYILSYKIKGRGVKNGRWTLAACAYQPTGEKVEHGDRGSSHKTVSAVHEDLVERGTMAPGASWSTVTREFTVQFKNKEANKIENTAWAGIELVIEVDPYVGAFYLDDVKLVPKS